ncbi:MAG: tetratricopeptide repeat-containing sensor histidine kinase [Bacteroidetes bacterium]|nr:tetratricopeptide repeat-containing sensor histidine kinase [Bacteroidota bacterium]
MKQKLALAKGDDRFDVLNSLFKETNSINYNEALTYATDFDNLALTLGDSVRIVQGGRMIAYSLMDLGRNDEAVRVLTRILGIARRNSEKYPILKGQIKFILNNAGIANTYLGNYDKALEFHFQSLVIREEEGDKKSIRTALNNIGLVFYNLKDYDKAIENYLKSIEISKELDDFNGFEGVYINLGLSFGQLGAFDDAIKYYKEGFKICKDNCNDNIVKEGLEGLGYAYKGNHQLAMAKENFLKSLDISKRQNDKRYMAENLFELGKIEIELNHEELGITYLKEAESLAEAINLAEIKLSIYNQFATFYGHKQEFQKSYYYQHKYIQFKDSIYSDKLIKNLTKVQTNYDQRENLKTIAEKDQVMTLQKEVYDRLQRQYFFIITITCLVVSLAIILFYFTRRQQKVNRQLSEAKNRIENQNLILASHNKELEGKVAARTQELILTNKALRQVNDELDNFIYKTSHDIRGPLATLKGMCNVALMDIRDPLAVDYLKKLDVTADRMNTILTRLMIVNQINGSVLVPVAVNFQEILNDVFAFEQKKGLPPRFSISCEVAPDSSIISDAALVRIILENLVDNAIKFYNTSERLDPYVKVRVFKHENRLKATVEDNGIGMAYRDGKDVFQMFMRASERSEIGGIGLYLAKLASEKIGGEINLIHSDSKGSLFEVSFAQDLRDIISLRSQGEQNLIALMEKQSETSQGQTLRPTDK